MLRLGLICALVFTLINSCSTDFQVNSEFEENWIVTGILDVSDSVHYVRIQSSFLPDNESVFEFVNQVEYLYPDEGELEVWMLSDQAFTDTLWFERIDGDTLGLPKAPGLFHTPNILYRCKANLVENHTYHLFVHVKSKQDTLTASTNLVKPFNILFPVDGTFGLQLIDSSTISFICQNAIDGKIYDMVMRFYYWEKDITSTDSNLLYADWVVGSNVVSSRTDGLGNTTFEIRAGFFLTFLAATLQPDPQKTRAFDRLSCMFYAGNELMYQQYLNYLANTGLGEWYATKTFSNIQGAYGLFGSRKLELSDPVFLGERTLDSLACGSVTGHLGFLPADGSCD